MMIEGALPNTREPYPAFPAWGKGQVILNDAIAASLLGQGDPETNLREAAEAIRGLL